MLVLSLALTACASFRGAGCRPGEQPLVHESLGMAAMRPNGTLLRKEEWDEFLKDVVTPRFPQGFAVIESSGQWRMADGTIFREPSRALILDHPDDAANEKAVVEIIAAYKTRFQQEAVYRVRSAACVSF